jgi:hypothetical protein
MSLKESMILSCRKKNMESKRSKNIKIKKLKGGKVVRKIKTD